jgi:hypothetical protein
MEVVELKLRIATRRSPLAQIQADTICSIIKKMHGIECEKVLMETYGDKVLDVTLSKIGGKGLFVKDIEAAMIEGRADAAVHSMKDVPFDIPEAETEITEGPVLEYSGTGLAMFKLTGGLKMVVISALAVALFFPSAISSFWLINILWFVLKCVLVIIFSITVIRATRARMRMDQAFKFYLVVPTVLALVSMVLTLFSGKL